MTQLGVNIPNLITGGSKTSLDLSIGGYFGTFWDGIYRYPRNEFEYANNWTYIRSSHTVEFGFDAKAHERSTADQDFESDGGVCFYGQVSGDNLADFMLGVPSFFAQYAPAYGTEERVAPGAYVTDAWKVRHNLTLNLGVRWSPWVPYQEVADNAIVMFNPAWFYENLHSTRYPNLPAGVLMAGDPGIPLTGFVSDYHVFDPRVGLAYDPFGNGKTSIRAGFGIYHDEPSANGQNGGIGEPPTALGATIPFPSSFDNPYAGQVNPFTTLGPPPSNTVFPLPLGLAGFSPLVRQPTIQQWNVTVERQLAPNLMLRAAYEGSESYHMYTGVEGNPATYIPGQSTLENIQSRRPNPGLQYALVQMTLGTASFNSMTISVEKRMSHGLSFLGGYRWAKCLDVVSQFTGEDINDPSHIRDQRGLCDYDLSRQFTFSSVWEPAVPQAFGTVASQVLGHWHLNGILGLHGGYPFSVLSGIDNAFEGPAIDLERADLTGVSPNLPSDRSKAAKLQEWFNVNAFAVNAPGTFGDSPRNFLRGPGFANLDLAVIRTFPLKFGPFAETQHLDFRAEFFNIFNRANFQNPNSDSPSLADGPVLGEILGAAPPRILQFALKFVF